MRTTQIESMKYRRRDSNPYDRNRSRDFKSIADIAETVMLKQFTEHTEAGLPSHLPETLQNWPDLQLIIEAWPSLPAEMQAEILRTIRQASAE